MPISVWALFIAIFVVSAADAVQLPPAICDGKTDTRAALRRLPTRRSSLSAALAEVSTEEREEPRFDALARDGIRTRGGVIEGSVHGVHGERELRIVALEN